MAGTEVTMSAPGPITRLKLNQIFECDVCKTTLAPTSLKRHKKTVHGDVSSGKLWKCNKCNKCLQTKSRLMQHERSHTSMVKENELTCQECKYFTNNKDYLKDHQRKMHKPKEGMWMCIKDSCAEKPKSFINNQLLSTHQKNHDNVPCTKCRKTFGAKRNLLRHIKIVHKASEDEDDRESQNIIGLNIANIDFTNVDMRDLLIMPLEPLPLGQLPLDPLTQTTVLPID